MNAEPPAPMGGAPIDQQPMPPMDGQQPPMGGGPNMPQDPNMGDAHSGEEPMGDMPAEGGDDSTMGIINQLSPKDKEAVRAYAESMLARDENQGGGEEGGEMPPMDGQPPMGGQAPMAESFIFKKRQLDKVNEIFGEFDSGEKEDKPLEKKTKGKASKKSPFNAPEFN